MEISVVIPTYNRRKRLLSILNNLKNSAYPVSEVIIVDSGQEKLSASELEGLSGLDITYIDSTPSVCIQRNLGISKAKSAWIFLCDDDIEIPADYLSKLSNHILENPVAGSVSGLVLQKNKGEWVAKYPVVSTRELLWKYIFKLSIWGEINCKNNMLTRMIKSYYQKKGNHITKAGWPVITDFSGKFFKTPVFGLGASLVRKDWLIQSPYDEVLDAHGIGDNYGVAAGFPQMVIHVVTDAFVYHHQEETNRLNRPLQYFRRVLAMDYFRRAKKSLKHVRKIWLTWSLFGSLFSFIISANWKMVWAAFKSMLLITFNRNPYYYKVDSSKQKIIEPVLHS
jgi:glycosyltransferase involved in cell wall biosynthesis